MQVECFQQSAVVHVRSLFYLRRCSFSCFGSSRAEGVQLRGKTQRPLPYVTGTIQAMLSTVAVGYTFLPGLDQFVTRHLKLYLICELVRSRSEQDHETAGHLDWKGRPPVEHGTQWQGSTEHRAEQHGTHRQKNTEHTTPKHGTRGHVCTGDDSQASKRSGSG